MVQAVIEVSKTHQNLLVEIAQAAVSARHIEAAEVWEAMLQVHNDNLKRDEQIITGILQTIGPCRVDHCELKRDRGPSPTC